MARMDARRRAALAALALALTACTCALAHAEDKVQLDPFARATQGFAACPEQPPPLLSPDQARVESHVRVERGLRCAMEGKCEPGGAYKRDPELNERVRAVIARRSAFRRYVGLGDDIAQMGDLAGLRALDRAAQGARRARCEATGRRAGVRRADERRASRSAVKVDPGCALGPVGATRRAPGSRRLGETGPLDQPSSRRIAISRSNTRSLARSPLCSNSLVSQTFMPAMRAAVSSDSARGTYMSSA